MSNERKQYLKELAEEYGVSLRVVVALAWMLGPNEDHDGLITELEDYCSVMGF